jgi:hypothetical protein
MKKIIILGFISFFSTIVTAQILIFETAGNVELCDDCGDSDVSMLCLKCNACKSSYADYFVWLFNYETKRLGEIQTGGLSADEERKQWISLKAYITYELNRIKGHIQSCVQSEMRQEEATRRAIEAAKEKQESPATYTPRSGSVGVDVKNGIGMNIAQAGDRLANTQTDYNESNVDRADRLAEEGEYWKNREEAAKGKIDDLNQKASRLNFNSNSSNTNKVKLQKLIASSQNGDKENEQLQNRKKELEEQIKKAMYNAKITCPACADAASNK